MGYVREGWLMSHRRIHPWPKVNTEQQRLKMNLVMFSGLVAALPKCDWQHAIDFFLQILGFVSFCLWFFYHGKFITMKKPTKFLGEYFVWGSLFPSILQGLEFWIWAWMISSSIRWFTSVARRVAQNGKDQSSLPREWILHRWSRIFSPTTHCSILMKSWGDGQMVYSFWFNFNSN